MLKGRSGAAKPAAHRVSASRRAPERPPGRSSPRGSEMSLVLEALPVGILMVDETVPTGLPEAIAYAARGWQKVRQHLDEVFFGDLESIGP